jgi:N-acetylglucosamine malate deacetylase 2
VSLEALLEPAKIPRPLPFTMVVVAHPDDEVIGLGSLLPRLRDAVFVYVTDGSPRSLDDAYTNGLSTREEYARARHEELTRALVLAGIKQPKTVQVGLVDQEAALHLAPLARELAEEMRARRPRLVITHPYEGGHPDHDATTFGVHTARRLLAQRGEKTPILVEAGSYHNSPNGIAVGAFLPSFLPNERGREIVRTLSEEEQDLKRRLLACFPTQRAMLSAFRTDEERFRPAPAYDFTRPPHEGKLFYELFPWGMTGERFRALAREALGELGLA